MTRLLKSPFFATWFLLLCCANAHAGLGTWTTSDKSPSSVNAIAMDSYVPSEIVISSGGSFSRTFNSGGDWDTVAHGDTQTSGTTASLPTFPSVNLVRLHNQTDIFFSGTPGQGLFRNSTNATYPLWPSTCGSATLPDPLPSAWERMDLSGPLTTAAASITANISALAVHPNQPWLAFSAVGNGVYVMTNAGARPTQAIAQCIAGAYITTTTYPAATWSTTTPAGFPSTPTINQITFDPSQAAGTAIGTTRIYAAVANNGVYASVNGGVNWFSPTQTVTSGSFTPATFNIAALTATTQSSSTVLYAGVTGTNAGLYKGVVTSDGTQGGTSIAWTQLTGSLQNLSTALSNIRAIAVDPITTTKVYIGTYGYGVYYLDNSTNGWADISNGLYTSSSNAVYVTSLQVDPLNPARIYAGTYGGFFAYEQLSTPKASVSPTTLSAFTTSLTQQTLTLSNSGVVPLTVSSITASGKFSASTSCPASLAVGSSCSISVQYQPTTSSDNGSLTISTNDPSSPIIIALSGSSGSSTSTTTPVLSLSPSSLSQFTSTNTTQTVTVTNSGTATLSITSVTASGSFTPTSTCPTTLNIGLSCTISIVYAPGSVSETSLLTIVSNDANSPTQINLTGVPAGSSGSGSASSGTTTVTPSSLTFSLVPAYKLSGNQSVVLKNGGSSAITINSVSTDNSAYTSESQCSSQVAAGASCSILVAYTPKGAAAASGTLTITLSTGSSISVTLNGTTADKTTMTGTAYGSTSGLSLNGNFYFSTKDAAATGNLYVAALVNGTTFFFDGNIWWPWISGAPKTYSSNATYASQTISILNREDVSQLHGAQVLLGYGTTISNVSKNQTYSIIYTVP